MVDLVGIGLILWKAFHEQVPVVVVELADRLVCREQLGQIAVAAAIELPAALEPSDLDLFQVFWLSPLLQRLPVALLDFAVLALKRVECLAEFRDGRFLHLLALLLILLLLRPSNLAIAPAGLIFCLDVDPAAVLIEMILVVKVGRPRHSSRQGFRHAAVLIETIPVVKMDPRGLLLRQRVCHSTAPIAPLSTVRRDIVGLADRESFGHFAAYLAVVVALETVQLAVDRDTDLSPQLEMLSAPDSLRRWDAFRLVLMEALVLMMVDPVSLLLGPPHW